MATSSVVYDFTSEDGAWKVSLSSNFLALTATNYIRWEEFSERLNTIIAALQRVYVPKTIARLGLRYKDIVDRDALGLKGVPWRELLAPHMLGVLLPPNVNEGSVTAMQTTVNFEVEGGSGILNHGLVRNADTQQFAYLIDADLFTSEKLTGNLDEINKRLAVFHECAGRLFHWCITAKLRDALEPGPIRA